ncbi:MAG: heterodisulfide reductase-related iron-sulfur binding cluster [Trichlorobacter sp.]
MTTPSKIDYRAAVTEMAARCTSCGACIHPCDFLVRHGSPAYIAQKSDRPETLVASFECSLCGECDARCPHQLKPAQLFLAMRQEAQQQGLVPNKRYTPWYRYEQLSRSILFRRYQLPPQSNTVFFPGCSFPGGHPESVRGVYALLQQIDPTIGLVLDCCNKITHDLGNSAAFDQQFAQLISRLKQKSITTIITACPGCTSIFHRYAGNDITVTNLYQFLASHGSSLQLNNVAHTTVSVHDPCPSRFDRPQQQAIRTLLTAIGCTISELPVSGRLTRCCGQGGMVQAVHPDSVTTEAAKIHPGHDRLLVTSCGGCREALSTAGRTVHLADLITGSTDTHADRRSSLAKWINRFKLRMMRLT